MNNDKLGARHWLFVAVIAAQSSGCSLSETSDLLGVKRTVFKDQVVVTTTAGQTFRGPSATIQIVAPMPNGPAAKASMMMSTVDACGMGLSVTLDVDPSALFDPTVSATLVDDSSTGTLALSSATGTEIVRSGRVSFKMARGTLEGFFETAHPLLPSGTIRGPVDVECLVPPEMLGQTSRGRTSQGTWLLVEDETFQSSFCQTFAGL